MYVPPINPHNTTLHFPSAWRAVLQGSRATQILPLRSRWSTTLVGYTRMNASVMNPSENGPYSSSQEGFVTEARIGQFGYAGERAARLQRTVRAGRKNHHDPRTAIAAKFIFGAKIPVGSRHNLIQLNEPGD